MSNKLIIPLMVSILLNCALGYYLHITKTDLKNSENTSQHYYNELNKQKQQLKADAIPEGFEIEYIPNKKAVHTKFPYIPMQPRTSEAYIPIQGNWASTQPAYYTNERTLSPYQNNYDPNLYRASKALENINTDIMLDSMFEGPYMVYPYPY